MGLKCRKLSNPKKFYKALLKMYLHYFPLRQGKKYFMDTFSPLIVGKGYQEIAKFDDGLLMLCDFDDWI